MKVACHSIEITSKKIKKKNLRGDDSLNASGRAEAMADH